MALPSLSFAVAVITAEIKAAVAVPKLVTPDWDADFTTAKEFCVDASTDSNKNNSRLVFVATPAGSPPAEGWPVYFSFVTDTYKAASGIPCGADAYTDKKALAFSTPEDTLKYCPCMKNNTCHTARPSPSPGPSSPRSKGLSPGATYINGGVNAWQQSPPHHHGGSCQYDTLSGELWDMRLKQFIVANGVAVVQVNPSEDDGWLSYDVDPSGGPTWSTGSDKPFLLKTFKMLKAGDFGPLDADNVVLRGWSGGAALVSWLINLQFLGKLPELPPLKAGMFLAGGSHDCYEPTQSTSHSQCKNCDPSDSCPGMPWHVNAGCSSNMTHAPCCTKCCPTDFTEQFFFDHPDQYAKHPPAFLSQTSLQDENADLCAAKNYYDTLVKHGVDAELVLVTPAYEKCYCIGDPRDPAAAGSPYSKYCLHDAMTWNCFTHEMGFAEMVVPSVKFLMKIFFGAEDTN